MERSEEESIARVEQERALIQPGEQLVLVYQDVYPQWNTYTVTLTPQNEEEVLKNVSADSGGKRLSLGDISFASTLPCRSRTQVAISCVVGDESGFHPSPSALRKREPCLIIFLVHSSHSTGDIWTCGGLR